MLVEVNYLQKRGKAGWRYRRIVPDKLRPVIGKREFLEPLGRTEAEALRAYPKVHAAVERSIVDAMRKLRAPATASSAQPGIAKTELERYRWATRHVAEWNLTDPDEVDVMADHLEATGQADLYRALVVPDRKPEPTLEDAKRLYLTERVKDDRKKGLELERVFRLVAEAVELSRTLDSLKRQDAKEVRDHMLDGRSATSVDRYLNVVRAAINHALKEFDLSCKNPFMGLEVGDKDKAEPDRDKRRPYTDAEVKMVRQRVDGHASETLGHIWRILEGTGCRLAEVAGLRVKDVFLDHAVPHIEVEWHDDRRVKTMASRRRVPLLGDALVAAKQAVKAAKGETALFPAYCREGGPASCSAILSKHVRAVVKDPKIGPAHSLRHRMADKLDLAGVQDSVRDRLLGHTKGEAREGYGGGVDAWLQIATDALRAAGG
ncbi:hypothetical protein ASD12_18605 [Mesorhizobium sp. Root102]|uniref:tyrosine-type recombinase/integrase n=1 Tax=Mesorhizobium sp. Root102 TaxID=1736422 RepID=UPI0006FAAD19|nr:site-specific integrase [Mesorhizobium sp. Root102]KQU99780.1 hypothetical protein ASD12_18605 [Mesorhizobium sp. Root102]